MDHLEFQAKTDRELLLLAAAKINDIDIKIDSVCVTIVKHSEELDEVGNRVTIIEEQIHSNKKILWGIVGGIIAIVSGVVTVVLKHIGLS